MTKQERQRMLAPSNIHPMIYLGLYGNIEFDDTYKNPKLAVGDHEEVIKRVSDFYEVSAVDVKSSSRKKEFVKARHIAMFILNKHSQVTLKVIGSLFSGRDHSTVINACTTVADQIKIGNRYNQEFYNCCGYVFGNIPYAIKRHLRPLQTKQHGTTINNRP